MNWDQIEGNWKQFKGNIKEQWDRLTHDQIERSEGKRERLTGTIQETYGVSSAEAERELADWLKRQRDIDNGGPVH